MGDLLFNPNGRITAAQFTKGAIILIVIGFVLSILPVLGIPQSIAMVLGFVTYGLIYPWIVLFMKRFRDAGKPGVMCLIPFAIYAVGSMVIGMAMMGGEIMQIAASGEAADPAEIEAMMKGKILPMAVVGSVFSAIVAFGTNALLKHDAHENQYGPEAFD